MCKFCQENFTNRKFQYALSDTEKYKMVQKINAHMQWVKDEGKFYNQTITNTRTNSGVESTTPDSVHWSFKMAQLVSLPHQPLQAGPVYFLWGYKVNIFGVMNDTVRRQYNYLRPEAVSVAKGSNYIISSMFHHANSTYDHGEKIYLYTDNCCWQNKNRCMMSYLNWRLKMDLKSAF